MTDKTIKQILLDAADIVAAGWTKRTYWNPTTNCHCARGALMRACGVEFRLNGGTVAIDSSEIEMPDYNLIYPETKFIGDVELFVDRLVREKCGNRAIGTITWNDQPEITQADVVALFREAAERA